jgi:hypothetical protein
MRGPTIMLTERGLLAISAAFIVSVRPASAQSVPTSGLYEIVSGTYTVCCGFGGEMLASVPNEGQSFVRITVDTQADLATMTFLGRDLQTVFSVVPCPTGNPIQSNSSLTTGSFIRTASYSS